MVSTTTEGQRMPRHVDSIKCGSCKGRHDTVAQVALCYALKWDRKAQEMQQAAEAKAEAAAEAAAERFYEEGPHGPADDPRERELWALEDMRADAIIAERKAATLELLARWAKANPGKRLTSYGCVPYSCCNCPTAFSRCSAFGVLDQFQAAPWAS
jgi:hypothetical protein